MSNILAIDTTLGGCTVALFGGASRTVTERNQQTSQLAKMVEEVMAESRMSFDELDAYAVTIGPGSFTGVRIGLAFIRGLALAVPKPIYAINTLELLAFQAIEQGTVGEIVAAMNAYRGQIYIQSFNTENELPVALTEPQAVEIDAVPEGDYTVVGDISEPFMGRPYLSQLPQAEALARYTEKLPIPTSDAKPSPLYLRPPDAKAQKSDLTVAQ